MPTFSPAPPTPIKQKNKALSATQAKKAPTIRRRPLDEDTTVYGDALFEEAIVPQRVTWVTFYDLLENNIRISSCRKFAVEYFPFHHQQIVEHEIEEGESPIMVWVETFNLYYFKDKPSPLMAFNPSLEKVFNIPHDKATESFLDLESISLLVNKIMVLEKLEQIAKILEEALEVKENESLIDATGTTNDAEFSTDTVTENEGEKTESVNEEKILSEISEEEKELPISELTQG